MADKNEGLFTLTTPAIMVHPGLFEARAIGPKGKESGKPKYSCNFMFKPDSPDLKDMKALCAKLAKAKWPGRDMKELKFPFSSGDKLADKQKARKNNDDGEFQRGYVVVPARSAYQPRLSMIANGRIVDLDGDAILANKDKFFFGAEALAQLNFAVYEGVGANPDGVTAYLNLVLVTGKGKKIGGSRQSGAEVFRGFAGSVSTADPTEGLDEVPF